MMQYNHFKRLHIESLIKALSMWKRASKVFPTAGRGPALPAINQLSAFSFKLLTLPPWAPVEGVHPTRGQVANPALPALDQLSALNRLPARRGHPWRVYNSNPALPVILYQTRPPWAPTGGVHPTRGQVQNPALPAIRTYLPIND